MRYASGTTVSADKSRLDLEKLLREHGATSFGYVWEHTTGEDSYYNQVVAFQLKDRSIRMTLPMPNEHEKQFTHTPNTGARRTTVQAHQFWEQEVRRRWRALYIVIKAKLVAIDDGISTIEREFLYDLVTADGRTVGEVIDPYLKTGGPLQITMEKR